MAEEMGSGMYYAGRDPESSRRVPGLATRFFSLAGCSLEPETANWREGPPPAQESNTDK